MVTARDRGGRIQAAPRHNHGMDAPRTLSPLSRLRLSLDLLESGVALMRQNLRRRHPAASEQELNQQLHDMGHGYSVSCVDCHDPAATAA
jgi:hypothetical protein